MATEGRMPRLGSECGAVVQAPSRWSVVAGLVRTHYREYMIYFALAVLVIGFSIVSPTFRTGGNLVNIGRQTAMVSVIAFAMTFALTAGEIDLSVGAVMALVGMMAGLVLKANMNFMLASLAGLATGVVFGLINGTITTRIGIPSFLVTLGTMGIARGTALTVTETQTIIYTDETFPRVWAGNAGPVPLLVVWTAVVLVICWVLYNRTTFGRYVQATGGNETAARFSGINTKRIKLMVLLMTGIASGVSGLMLTARLYSARPYVGTGMELDAIAAAILGGTQLFGGKGTIVGTLIGALVIGVINNGLVLVGVESYVQQIIKGAIIILAVVFAERSS